MKVLQAAVAAAALTLFATAAWAQDGFNYDSFEPATLAEAKAGFLAGAQEFSIAVAGDKPGDGYFDQGGRRWRAQASYTGKSRPLDTAELTFIRNWLKSVRREDVVGLFTTSYLFTADGKDYWLPVEAPVAAFFPKELKPGDVIDLYLAEIGGTRGEDGWIWLPLVEEFRRPEMSG
jgi:hypothetical protein